MDKSDSAESDRQMGFDHRLPPFEEPNKDVGREGHESPEEIVATNVTQQLMNSALEFQKHDKESQDLVQNLETRDQTLEDRSEQPEEEEPFNQNIEYHSEHRYSGQPIQQYIYDEEEEDEDEEEEDDDDLGQDIMQSLPKASEDIIESNVSSDRNTETIDDLMDRSMGSEQTTKDEILYQLSDDNVLTAQSYGFGRDLRIGSHSDQTLGPMSDYELNTDDPFSTPQHNRRQTTETEENFERFVENCEPFETIATDFGVSSVDPKNSLLDLDSGMIGMTQMSSFGREVPEESPSLVESRPESDHALSAGTLLHEREGSAALPSSGDYSSPMPVMTPIESLDESHIHSTNRSDIWNSESDSHSAELRPQAQALALELTQSPNLDTLETHTSHHFPTQDHISSDHSDQHQFEDTEDTEESPIESFVEVEAKQTTPEISAIPIIPTCAQTMTKPPKQSTEETVADAGCSSSPCAWFNPNQLNPTVAELVYWRDPKKSGIVFGAGLAILLSLTVFSIISVVAYASLAALSVTLSFRIYKNILQAVQKTNEGHPFKEYLEIEITPSSERIHQIVDSVLAHITSTLNKLRSVFLVEDIIDSLKFVVLFWCLTYIGSWFNGLTLIILAYLGLFSLPKVYEMNKTQIDQYLTLASTQINEITSKIRAKIPFPAKKEKDN